MRKGQQTLLEKRLRRKLIRGQLHADALRPFPSRGGRGSEIPFSACKFSNVWDGCVNSKSIVFCVALALEALAQGIVRDMKASASFHIAPGTAPAIPPLCLFASFRTYSRVVFPRCSLISASSGSPCTPIRLGIFRVRYAR